MRHGDRPAKMLPKDSTLCEDWEGDEEEEDYEYEVGQEQPASGVDAAYSAPPSEEPLDYADESEPTAKRRVSYTQSCGPEVVAPERPLRRPPTPPRKQRSRSPRQVADLEQIPRHLSQSGRPPDENERGSPRISDQDGGGSPPIPAHAVAGGRPPDPASSKRRAAPVRLRVDGAALHSSHSFGFHRGVYWCWRCQGVASAQPKKLAKPCEVPVSTGLSDLSGGRVGQLRNKRLPSNMAEWPLPEGATPHPAVLIQNQPQ